MALGGESNVIEKFLAMDVLHLAFILEQRQKFPGESNVVVKGLTESGFCPVLAV